MNKHLKVLFLVAVIMALVVAGCGPTSTPTKVPEAPTPTKAPEVKERFPGLVAPGVLTVADSGKTPPGTMVGDNGEPVGAWIDLCQKWADDLGLELEVVYLDWAGVLPGLTTGKFDIAGSGVRHTPERLASPDYRVLHPHRGQSVGIMVRKGSGIDTYADLAGKRLGATRGEAYEAIVKDQYVEELGKTIGEVIAEEVKQYPGHQEGMLDLLNDRIDAYTTSTASLTYMAKESPQGDELAVLQPTLSPNASGTFIRNDLPELEEALNQLIDQYLEDGTMHEIHAKWWGDPNPVDILMELKAQEAKEVKVEITGLVTPGVLTVADSGKTPPGTMVGDNGEPVGAWIDLCQKWADDLGLELEVVYLDWAGVLPGLTTGKFDIAGSGVRHTPERLASPDYRVLHPHRGQSVGIMVRKGSGIDTYADLAGKRLGATRGEAYEAIVKDQYVEELGKTIGEVIAEEVKQYPGHQEGMLDLLNDRIDAYTTSTASLTYMAKESPQGDELAVLQPTLSPNASGTFIRNDLPELEEALNQLIDQYLEDGTMHEIHAKWWGDPNPVDILMELKAQQ